MLYTVTRQFLAFFPPPGERGGGCLEETKKDVPNTSKHLYFINLATHNVSMILPKTMKLPVERLPYISPPSRFRLLEL